MLSINEFKKDFILNCKDALFDAGASDLDIIEKKVCKAQRGDLTGLMFRTEGSNVAPTIYVEDFYRMYKEGVPVTQLSLDAAESVIQSMEYMDSVPADDFDITGPGCGLRVRLLSRRANEDFLTLVPYRDMGNDLVLIAEMVSGEFSAVITNDILDSTGLSQEQLFEDAMATSVCDDPAVLYDLQEAAIEMDSECGLTAEDLDLLGCEYLSPSSGPAYVLSTRGMFRGARALFYPGITDRLHSLLGDFYILPSSVHELIVLREDGQDPAALAEMVRSANDTVVAEADILSYDVYLCTGGGDSSITRVSK